MRQISFIVIGLLIALTIKSQQTTSVVSITVTGNRNLQVEIDGKGYSLTNSIITGNTTSLTISNLSTGQHNFRVTRTDMNTSTTEKISTIFILRYGYDMLIKVNENGSLELIETRKASADIQAPMNSTAFNTLLKNVKAQRTTTGRRNLIANAFNNNKNYFTTYQAAQLLQQITVESTRLELAKLSYRNITDKGNFYQLYDLFSNDSNKNELEAYVNNYNTGTSVKVPMPDDRFSSLYETIKQQWPVSTQMNSLKDAFNDNTNYFTTYQASQLIQIVVAESNRLQLARLSYRSITDRSNFYQVFDLLYTQSARNELQAYVNSYAEDGSNLPMSDGNFTTLYESVKKQWPVSTQINSITNAFNNVNNYFTSYQASSLIQLIGIENNRLQLAKLSYRSITDKDNFYQVADLLYSQSSKDELAAYIKNYNAGTIITKVPMSDAAFNDLYQAIQLQFFPGQRMTSLTDTFNTAGYYFTSIQAKKLITLISLESNRLQLAKLSYKTITDRNNFSTLYDLFATQASKDELDAYVKAYKD